MARRHVLILPIAVTTGPPALLFGEDLHLVRRDVARGLGLDLTNALNQWPGIVAHAAGTGDADDHDDELVESNAPPETSWSPDGGVPMPDDLAINLARAQEKMDRVVVASLSLYPDVSLTIRLLHVAKGEPIVDKTFSGTQNELIDVVESGLAALAAALVSTEEDTKLAVGTRSSKAYVNFLVGLSEFERSTNAPEAAAPVVLTRLGVALENDEGFKKAYLVLTMFIQAGLGMPGFPSAMARRALDRLFDRGIGGPLLYRQRGLLEMERDQPAAARRWFDRALATGDHAPTCSYYLARCAESLQDWKTMARWTGDLVAAKPDDAGYHFLHGVAAIHDGRLNDALAAWRKALELDGELAAARSNIALALLRHGQPEAAWRELEDYLFPEDRMESSESVPHTDEREQIEYPWEFLHVAAAVIFETGRHSIARDLVDGFLEGRRAEPKELIEAARLLIRWEDKDRASEVLQDVLMLTPDDESGDIAGRLLCALEEPAFEREFHLVAEQTLGGGPSAPWLPTGAQGDLPRLENWSKRFPHCWGVWYVLGMGRWRAGDLPGARTALDEALARRPSHPELLLRAAWLALDCGDPDRAATMADRAVEAPVRDSRVHAQAAILLAYARRPAEATRRLLHALRLDPGDPVAALARPLMVWVGEHPDAPRPPAGRLTWDFIRQHLPRDEHATQGMYDQPIERRAAGAGAMGIAAPAGGLGLGIVARMVEAIYRWMRRIVNGE